MSNIRLVPTTFTVYEDDTVIGIVIHVSKNKWSGFRERSPFGYRLGFTDSNEAIKWLESDAPSWRDR